MVDNQINSSSVTPLVSNNVRDLIALVTMVYLCGIIGIFGSLGNVINLIVFYRQGLDTTINISFFSLAVSDLCSLTMQQLYNVYINPLFVNLDLPIIYKHFQYMTTALYRSVFSRITCQITAFITAERCICVVFPLHVKRIITPRVSSAVIIAIYVLTILSPCPLFCTSYLTWRFYPDLNRTLLGFAVTSQNGAAEAFGYLVHALFSLLGFTSVLIFTLILINKLREKSGWRQAANVDLDKAKSISKRDRNTIHMVVLIACILIVTYTPGVLLCLATIVEPEFSQMGRHYNIFYSLWKCAFICEAVNSSVNVFFYYRMSSKYRSAFVELFSACFQRTESSVNRDTSSLAVT